MNRMSDDSLRRSIRAIGAFLYLIAFLALGCSALPHLVLKPADEVWRHVMATFLVAASGFFFLLARSLRKFRSWSRVAAIVVSCIGILGFPFGAFLCGPFLYVLLKSKHLFDPLRTVQPLPANAAPSEIDRLAA